MHQLFGSELAYKRARFLSRIERAFIVMELVRAAIPDACAVLHPLLHQKNLRSLGPQPT